VASISDRTAAVEGRSHRAGVWKTAAWLGAIAQADRRGAAFPRPRPGSSVRITAQHLAPDHRQALEKEPSMNATTTTVPAAQARRGRETSAAVAPTAPFTRLIGGAFIAAPVTLLASSVAFAAGLEPARGVLQFYAAALFMFVLVTLAQTIAAGAPCAAVALALLAVVGMTAGAGFAIDNIHGALLDDAYLVDDGGTAGILVSQIPGLMGPIAWVGFGVALLQLGLQPRWSGWALIAGGILFPVSRIGDIAPLAVADDLIFVAALAPLGLALMRGRDLLGR
jgi:hypothetical protein